MSNALPFKCPANPYDPTGKAEIEGEDVSAFFFGRSESAHCSMSPVS